MAQPDLISSKMEIYQIGFRISNGDPIITYTNTSGVITSTQIATYCLNALNSRYITGKNSTSIPIVFDTADESIKHGVAAARIEGAVVTGGSLMALTPLTNPSTNAYDISVTKAGGNPETVGVMHGGSNIHIFEYTGTAPTKPVAGTPAATDWVVCSATACLVQTAATVAAGQQYGSLVIAVDTTLKLVACKIRGC